MQELINWLQVLVYHFQGAGKNKYLNEILEVFSALDSELSPLEKDTILHAWVTNPSGKAGAFQESDLFQEHLNKIIKVSVMSKQGE